MSPELVRAYTIVALCYLAAGAVLATAILDRIGLEKGWQKVLSVVIISVIWFPTAVVAIFVVLFRKLFREENKDG